MKIDSARVDAEAAVSAARADAEAAVSAAAADAEAANAARADAEAAAICAKAEAEAAIVAARAEVEAAINARESAEAAREEALLEAESARAAQRGEGEALLTRLAQAEEVGRSAEQVATVASAEVTALREQLQAAKEAARAAESLASQLRGQLSSEEEAVRRLQSRQAEHESASRWWDHEREALTKEVEDGQRAVRELHSQLELMTSERDTALRSAEMAFGAVASAKEQAEEERDAEARRHARACETHALELAHMEGQARSAQEQMERARRTLAREREKFEEQLVQASATAASERESLLREAESVARRAESERAERVDTEAMAAEARLKARVSDAELVAGEALVARERAEAARDQAVVEAEMTKTHQADQERSWDAAQKAYVKLKHENLALRECLQSHGFNPLPVVTSPWEARSRLLSPSVDSPSRADARKLDGRALAEQALRDALRTAWAPSPPLAPTPQTAPSTRAPTPSGKAGSGAAPSPTRSTLRPEHRLRDADTPDHVRRAKAEA